MYRIVKRLLFVVPMIACLFAFSGKEQANASTNEVVKVVNTNLIANQPVKLTDNSLLNQQNKGDTQRANIGFGLIYHNSFGVEIDGCYYQVEQTFDSTTGQLYCGTLIVFCKDSVEIYTGGQHCS
jgi:hypothetical protein